MRFLVSIIFFALFSIYTFGQDFTYEYEGRVLTYTIVNESERTCQTKEGESTVDTGFGYAGNPDVSGKLVIPDVVVWEQNAYRVVAIGNASFAFSDITSVYIPASINLIGQNAFKRCRYLKKVSIDNSSVSIGDCAFEECTALNSLSLGEGVVNIGNNAFHDCTNLASVTVPNSTLYIGNGAFQDCTSLKSADIGDSVKYIGKSAFNGCKLIKSVTVPNSVESIGAFAFKSCDGLRTANIGYSVMVIGESAFEGCGLESVSISSSDLTVEDNAFNNCRSLERAEFTSIEALCGYRFANAKANPLYFAQHLYIAGKEIIDLNIPDNVKSIGNYTFRNCSFLNSVRMSDDIFSVGREAFYNCYSVHDIGLSNSISIIEDYAFNGCGVNISSMVLPNSVTTVGEYAFNGWKFTSVFIPASVSYIGEKAFGGDNLEEIVVDPDNLYYCSLDGVLFNKNLDRLIIFPNGKKGQYVIPNTLTSIPDQCFRRCNINSIIIPETIVEIGKSAFEECMNLVSITIPQSVTCIRNYAFRGCSLISVLICSADIDIDQTAFYACSYIKKVAIPFNCDFPQSTKQLMYYSPNNILIEDGVMYSWDKTIVMFANSDLKDQYVIPSSVTQINSSAFSWCDQMTSIVIPGSINDIGIDSFMGCDHLTSVYYDCNEPLEIPDRPIFGDYIEKTTLYVPENAVDRCTLIEPWKNFHIIEAYDFSDVDMIDTENQSERIYNLNGISVGSDTDRLEPGIYILHQNGKSKKIFVK